MFDVDWMGLLTREVLRERTAALDRRDVRVGRRHVRPAALHGSGGRVVATGQTVGERAALGLPLSGDEDVRLDLADARPGTFRDALGAVDGTGTLHADRFDAEVLHPFVLETCLAAAERGRRTGRGLGRTRRRRGRGPGDLGASSPPPAGRGRCASTPNSSCSRPWVPPR